jgi:hypothetical protein
MCGVSASTDAATQGSLGVQKQTVQSNYDEMVLTRAVVCLACSRARSVRSQAKLSMAHRMITSARDSMWARWAGCLSSAQACRCVAV